MRNGISEASENVEERLRELFIKRLNIKIEDQDALLLGARVGLSARDLIYICLDVEKEFDVSIDDECIQNHLLTTFSNIKGFILSRVGHVADEPYSVSR